MPAVCEVCDQEMRPGVNCVERSPLENRALVGGYLQPGVECNDCNAPAGGNHHDRCKFLWCPEHDVQFLLCAKEHRPPAVH